jgi:N-acyl-D-aspartate/D-glutamate deacylase
MSLDLKISGGTIVDGTGAARYSADVGIRDGRVVEIGAISTPAKRILDADGTLVTPGFVDMHTHYDAQVLWDSELISSSRNGVTTAVMGNCGVGCAPFSPSMKDGVKALLEGVEDIPSAALDVALSWNWDTFSSYLNRVAERPHTINLAANVAHAPMRMAAMGERAIDGSAPTGDDISRMQAMLDEALRSGASAFSTDRIELHQMAGQAHVPDWHAPRVELLALAQTLAKYPKRPMQYASDYGMVASEVETIRELELLAEIVALGVPVFTPLQQYPIQGGWRRLAADVDKIRTNGATIKFEASARAIGALLGLEALIHPFSLHPSYMAIANRPLSERVAIMQNPDFRARILSEAPQLGPLDARIKMRLDKLSKESDRIFVMGPDVDYEPDKSKSIKARAERESKTLQEVFYDALIGNDGRDLLYVPLSNFADGKLDEQREILSQPDVMLSFGDAGAHLASICDSAYSSFCLTHWSRDRAVGIPLEQLIQKMTSAQADLFGFRGRGRIEVGAIADINVIDHAALKLDAPEMLHDIPGGGSRLMQCATGYIATLVGGETIVEQDKLTGAMPGSVLRCLS